MNFNELLEKADNAYKDKQYDLALNLYEQAIVVMPKNSLGHQGAALSLLKLSSFEKAIAMSNKSLEIDSSVALPHVVMSNAFYSQGKIQQSVDEARIAYNIDSNSIDTLVCYGSSLLLEKKIGEAISIFKRADGLFPNNYPVQNNLTIAYLQQKDAKKAYFHMKDAYRLKPSLFNGIRLFVVYLLAKQTLLLLGLLFVPAVVLAVVTRLWVLFLIPTLFLFLIFAIRLILKKWF